MMKIWLSDNAVWLGSLGAIAAIISLLVMLVAANDEETSTQDMDLDGANHTVTQIQDNSGGGNQSRLKETDTRQHKNNEYS